MTADEALNQMDANKDGAISLQEHTDYSVHEADTRFSRMDRDKDGRLTSQELADAEKRRQSMKPDDKLQGGPQPQGPQSLLTRADSNHDGVVDSAENRAMAQQQVSRRFQFSDRNGDGILDRGELQAKPRPPGGTGD